MDSLLNTQNANGINFPSLILSPSIKCNINGSKDSYSPNINLNLTISNVFYQTVQTRSTMIFWKFTPEINKLYINFVELMKVKFQESIFFMHFDKKSPICECSAVVLQIFQIDTDSRWLWKHMIGISWRLRYVYHCLFHHHVVLVINHSLMCAVPMSERNVPCLPPSCNAYSKNPRVIVQIMPGTVLAESYLPCQLLWCQRLIFPTHHTQGSTM